MKPSGYSPYGTVKKKDCTPSLSKETSVISRVSDVRPFETEYTPVFGSMMNLPATGAAAELEMIATLDMDFPTALLSDTFTAAHRLFKVTGSSSL